MKRFRFLFALILWCLALQPVEAMAKRVALVIGNSRYTNANMLPNPSADAKLVAASLKRAGFDTVDIRLDLGKSQLESELRAFGEKSEGADVALVYYAGHGIEAGGQNYLIPTDAKLQRDRDLEVEATRLDTVLLMGEGARMRIVVLDACRNNPFATTMQRTMRSRAVGRGLAAVEPEGETLVVFAAKAGATAADGEGANSPFAEALSKRIAQPGLEISLLFRAVRDDVLAKTGRQQEPFTYGSLSGTAFYFVGGPNNAAAPVAAAPALSGPSTESLYWQGALAANTDIAFREYLKAYPKGTFATLAQQNLRRFQTAPTPQPKVSPTTNPGGMYGAVSTLPNLGAAFSAPTGQVSAGAGASVAARYTFTPLPDVRARATRNFLIQMKQFSQEMGNALEKAFAQQDIFAATDKAVAPYGLKTNNVADVMAIFIDTMRDVANGRSTEPSRKQALAVRDQMALVLLATPSLNQMSVAQRQETTDTMLLTAVTFSFILDAAKSGDQQQLRVFSDQVADLMKTQYGIDLRAIRITDEGYRM
jgi:uncharacterized caspase-like protein